MENETKQLNALLEGVDEFANAMKDRIREKAKQGVTGWKGETLEHLQYQIEQGAYKLPNDKKNDIDIANWCAMHFLNRENKR